MNLRLVLRAIITEQQAKIHGLQTALQSLLTEDPGAPLSTAVLQPEAEQEASLQQATSVRWFSKEVMEVQVLAVQAAVAVEAAERILMATLRQAQTAQPAALLSQAAEAVRMVFQA